MKALVVYYSRTGATREVARSLSEALKGDIDEIGDVKGRRGPIGFIRSGREASRKELPEIRDISRDTSGYDILIIGTPVWAGTMASPVRTFLARRKGKLRKAAFFCTMGGGDEQKTFSEMEGLLGARPLCTLAVPNSAVKSGEYRSMVKKFAARINR